MKICSINLALKACEIEFSDLEIFARLQNEDEETIFLLADKRQLAFVKGIKKNNWINQIHMVANQHKSPMARNLLHALLVNMHTHNGKNRMDILLYGNAVKAAVFFLGLGNVHHSAHAPQKQKRQHSRHQKRTDCAYWQQPEPC